MAEVCHAIAHGSLMGARGNSGVILSQILRGFADTFAGLDAATGDDVVTALRRAADAAYEAVLRPVEGTILTVVRAPPRPRRRHSATASTASSRCSTQPRGARTRRCSSTPELLPVLADAGVVDAGGKGFTLLLDAFLEVVAGRPIPEPEIGGHTAGRSRPTCAATTSPALRYEVMYLLEADDATIPAFQDTWGAIGDSIVVVGGDGIWNCHVHTERHRRRGRGRASRRAGPARSGSPT